MASQGTDTAFGADKGIDKVRASKAGHAFHEAWAARSALELLLPKTELVSITLEGFDEVDEADLGTGAVEIADLVRYYGHSDVAHASRVDIIQFKYSIASAAVPVRAADLAGTLTKFAQADADLQARHGAAHVEQVIRYDYATNRPIHPNLTAAIAATIAGVVRDGDIAKQQAQLTKALRDYPHAPDALLRRLVLSGGRGSLSEADHAVGQILASWSGTSDPEAEVRLLKLRNLVRTKAGAENDGDKRINRVAVLAELKVAHEDQLYPTEDAFPPIGTLIARPIVEQATAMAREPGLPLIIHGAGGMGKTVLMQGLAATLGARDQVVIFDGFGAGRWRDPADGRHRPEKTLVHLANLLAGHGLCDILLPISEPSSLLRAFRQRLTQSVATVRQASAEAGVVLILDAIDHSAIAAEETHSTSFAHNLLRSLAVEPIPGVVLIASCRTERRAQAVGETEHRVLEITAFTPEEARSLILARDPDVTPVEVAALEARSGRNPRCLDTLLLDGRPYDLLITSEESAAPPAAVLDRLLRKRIDAARQDARVKGTSDADIDLLLTSLALLPPPVPIDELAAAHGIVLAQVESFAADLAPLLERTRHGLMFRDEPTETLIRKMSAADASGRTRIVAALFARQADSNYAARALPALLTTLGDVEQLITLAFDERVPPGASKVSLRDIRLARITAALDLCAKTQRRDDLMRLLLEASIVAAGHERADRFLYEFPDLAAIAGDAEALRRLFSTQAGWPGGRHSALALAYAFSGDMGEARRNARRAIDWHNLASKGNASQIFDSGKASTWLDDVGFAYVEMLAGNDTRVAEFFARCDDSLAYSKFCELFDLLERQRCGPHPPDDRVMRRLQRCRMSARSLWAAALHFSDRDPAKDRRLVARFAAAQPDAEHHDPLPAASLSAAARAMALDRMGDARAILTSAAVPRPRLFDYRYWSVDRDADTAVVHAGLNAALCGRPVTLSDLAPKELFEIVPASIRARGAAAFEKDLHKRLAEPRQSHGTLPQRRRKSKLDYNTRSEYRDALRHRIVPLLPYAQAIADIVSLPKGQTPRAILTSALERLALEVDQTSDYPFRDGKPYRARIGFQALFLVADALGIIDPPIAAHLAAWLPKAPGIFTPQLIAVITRLARYDDCHDAALTLAAHAERQILLDTDISSRVSSYGKLSRAVWRVSTEDAAVYFRRTLDLADAFGSDDFDRANHLLELTGHYAGPELAAPVGHSLARIFELNQNEDSKFPWIEYAQTMAPLAGLASLAMTARLDDRDKASLGLSLGPTLTMLLRRGKLSGDVAACLFGLAAPSETWTWCTSAFVEAALATLPAEHREWLFAMLLVEIDRDAQLSPWRNLIAPLLVLAEEHLPIASPSRARIEALVQRLGPEEPCLPRVVVARVHIPFGGDLADPEAIDREILNEVIDQSGQRWPQRTIADLALHANTPTKRLAFVRAVVSANTASLIDKLWALDNFLPDWSTLSPAMAEALPGLAVVLARKHAAELITSESQGWSAWQGLFKDFHGDRPALVEAVVEALGGTAAGVSGDAWLALAAKLAPAVSSAALAAGLERFVLLTDATLPAEVGDGPWNPHFAVDDDQINAAAGLIWARLGHPTASIRWRAAHAILRLAAVNRFDVIDQLVRRYDRTDTLPFGDAKLPAYPMHSQLWLLIALARIAADRPARIAAYSTLFERIAFADEFPHVVMRAFAVDALRAIAPVLAPDDREALIERLARANQSPFPHAPASGFGEGRYLLRPESVPPPTNAFHLDYDFLRYQLERVCHVFGCAGWEVEDRITHWVRRWDATVTGMFDCPRGGNRHADSWSSGSVPEVDRYGGYLGWHGLMLSAGEMLQTRVVTGEDWGGDAWAHFLADYRLTRPDGRWLAEATDLFPLDLPKSNDLPMPEVETAATEREDHALLQPMLNIADGQIAGPWMPVAGRWSLPNDTSATLATVLTSPEDAATVLMTLLTDENFFRWLPDDTDEIASHFGQDGHTVREWIATVQHSERHFDRTDAYAATTATQRAAPSAWICEQLDLAADDLIVRSWSSADGAVFRAETWGATGGRGETSWDDSGERISVERSHLLHLLETNNLVLVGSLKLQRYHKGKPSGRLGDASSFTHRSLVFSVDPSGRVKTPRNATKAARDAVAALDALDRRDFHKRFIAIRAAL